MIRSTAHVLAPPDGSDLESRLLLTEHLLASEDPGVAATRSLDWLVGRAGVRQAVCLLLDNQEQRLTPVASVGVTPGRLEDWSLPLEETDHPLLQTLSSARPQFFHHSARQPQTPLERCSFHAIPLRSRSVAPDRPVGMLLVNGTNAQPAAEVRWLCDVLGEKMARVHALHAHAENVFAPERTLLYGIINAVTDPILLTDPEGKLIIANARAEKLFSAPEDASEGRRRAVTLNNMLFSAALATHAVENPEMSRRELLLVDPIEGSDLLFELLSSPMRDAHQGNAIVSILRNVTDLGRAMAEIQENYQKLRLVEAEVRAERHRLDLIIDSVADPILVTDANGDIVLMNEPAEKLFTPFVHAGEAAQRRVRANEAHFSSFVANLLASGEDLRWRGEMTLVEPQAGGPMPVEAVAGKILSEQGELTAVVTILHDRAEEIEKAKLYEQLKQGSAELERKVQEATAELAKQNELLRRQHIELEQASALKTQFLANMSHEFRTPLNAILGYTHMLLQGVSGPVPPEQRKKVDRINSNGRHLLALINDILDISRIEAGRMPLHTAEFKLAELVAEVMAELEPMISRAPVKVTTELAKKVPILRSDRKKVKQIVVNLLSNALKFTHQGSIRIVGSHNPRTRQVTISVIDTGIGIAPENHERVFEDFRQLDNSPTRQYSGTGLGLAICRRLAGMLGGKITLESENGKGSTFTLHVPVRPRRR